MPAIGSATARGLICAQCGKQMAQVAKSLPQGLATCRACRASRPRQQPQPNKPLLCSVCGQAMYKGTTSMPQGQATCRACRRQRQLSTPTTPARLTVCARCFGPKPGPRFKYCTACARIVRKGSTPPKESSAARGYGNEHRRVRRQWAPIVARGDGYCHARECKQESRWIIPGTPWDLGHTPDRTTWTGPEHPACNRSEGASRGNKSRRQQRAVILTGARRRRWAL